MAISNRGQQKGKMVKMMKRMHYELKLTVSKETNPIRKACKWAFPLLFALSGTQVLHAQTQFDSLKRNSHLDTAFQPSQKPTFVTESAELKISGFVQPALYYDNNSVFSNDLFITSEIPTSDLTSQKFHRFHISANQGRLGFGFKFPKSETSLSAFMEGDFLSSSRGSHTYFRLRHAYISYGDFLIGQTWTNFGDVNGSPNTLDLEGPNSMPASRVAQVRWRKKLSREFTLILAIEEPKADYTPLDSAEPQKAAIPELVVKPQFQFGKFRWVNSVIYKSLVYTDKEYSFKKFMPTWGVSSSLTFSLPDRPEGHYTLMKKKNVNLFVVTGKGTQGAINDFGGLGYEAFPKDDVSLETLSYFGSFVSYSFVLNKRWSSTYVFSYLHQEKPEFTDEILKNSIYLSGNAIYAFNRYFNLGGELLYGVKENYDDTRGRAFRFLVIMRVIF
jgi:hypothetical protein